MACSAGTTRDFPRKRIYGRAIPEWPGTLSISPRPLLTVYQPLALLGSPLGAGGWEVFPRSGICVPLSPPPLPGPPPPLFESPPTLPGSCIHPCLGPLLPCLGPLLLSLSPLLPSLGPASSPAWVPSSPAWVLPPPLVTQTLLDWPARQ